MFLSRHRCFTIAARLAVVVMLCFAPASRGAQQHVRLVTNQVLSARTRLVAVPVSVINKHGKFVSGLTESDFRIWQDGHPQSITFFEQQNTPVTVGLIVDHSGSMSAKMPHVAAAVYDLAHFSNRQDQIFVVDFADTVKFAALGGNEFTSNPRLIQRAVTRVRAAGETALYDAVAAALRRLTQGRWNKKALVIVSDGGDNVSHDTFRQVLQMARSSRVVVFAVGLIGASGQQENPGVLRMLCHDTGGMAFFPHQVNAISAATRKIALDIRDQYMLGYIPPKGTVTSEYHRLKVKVVARHRGKFRVRARRGFVAGGEYGIP